MDYYKGLLGVTEDRALPDRDIIATGLVVEEESRSDLVKDVTDLEIKVALWDIDDNKAPGPDGYGSKFFKAAWPVLGEHVSLNEFFLVWTVVKGD